MKIERVFFLYPKIQCYFFGRPDYTLLYTRKGNISYTRNLQEARNRSLMIAKRSIDKLFKFIFALRLCGWLKKI